MRTTPAQAPATFDPTACTAFRFCSHDLSPEGRVTLRYALDDEHFFEEVFELPVPGPLSPRQIEEAMPLVGLLHLVAGVSYFKTALPPNVAVETTPPGPATAALLDALYSLGLAELAYENGRDALPAPRFPVGSPGAVVQTEGGEGTLIPIGGGKDSLVAVEIARRAGVPFALFSVGDAAPIARSAQATGVERLIALRTLDPGLSELNAAGAINGHVPITAIVSCVALLTAALHGFDRVAMANERSASHGNLVWNGVEINHQFSKGLACERLLRGALAEVAPGLEYCSLLRPASELGIARAFARMPQYHGAFTSCNALFRLDEQRRAATWCGNCPKCRFVFLILAPFMAPQALRAIFGADLLADIGHYDDFALLVAVGGHKPFECVGEEEESLAALRLLAADPRWREEPVVAALHERVLATLDAELGDPARAFALHDDHEVPADLLPAVHALLGA